MSRSVSTKSPQERVRLVPGALIFGASPILHIVLKTVAAAAATAVCQGRPSLYLSTYFGCSFEANRSGKTGKGFSLLKTACLGWPSGLTPLCPLPKKKKKKEMGSAVVFSAFFTFDWLRVH